MLLVLKGVAHNPLETSLRKSMSMLSFLGFLPPKTTTRNSYERSRRRNCSGSRVPQVNGYFTSHHQLVPHINQRTFEFLVFSDTHPSSYMLYCHRRFKPPHNFDSRLVFHRFISGYREKLSKTAIKHSLLEFTFYQVFGTFGFFLPQCSRYSCSPPRRPSCKWLTVLNSWHSRELGYTTPCRKANKKVCFCPSEKGSKKVQKKNPLFCPRFQNYRAPLILGLAANGQLF